LSFGFKLPMLRSRSNQRTLRRLLHSASLPCILKNFEARRMFPRSTSGSARQHLPHSMPWMRYPGKSFPFGVAVVAPTGDDTTLVATTGESEPVTAVHWNVGVRVLITGPGDAELPGAGGVGAAGSATALTRSGAGDCIGVAAGTAEAPWKYIGAEKMALQPALLCEFMVQR
jgi:hypothetical protein